MEKKKKTLNIKQMSKTQERGKLQWLKINKIRAHENQLQFTDKNL